MRAVLVTGGAGFIGSHLVDHLLDRGAMVRVLDDISTGSLRNLQAAADGPVRPGTGPGRGRRLELMVGDIRDERLVRRAMQHIDCVFHMAALSSRAGSPWRPTEMHSVNGQGTVNVLQAAAAEGVRRVVFASCASVYGGSDLGPLTEGARPQPASVFAASKLAGEIYCEAYQNAGQIETVRLRYFGVYGPRQSGTKDGALVPLLIRHLRQDSRPTIPGNGRTAQEFMYIDDAVQVTLAAGERPEAAGRAIDVASGQQASAMEVLAILNRLLRTDLVPRLGRGRDGAVRALAPVTSSAREVLGCVPHVSLVAGLARCVETFAEAEDESALSEVAPL